MSFAFRVQLKRKIKLNRQKRFDKKSRNNHIFTCYIYFIPFRRYLHNFAKSKYPNIYEWNKKITYRMVCLLLWLFCILIFTTLNFSNDNTSAGGNISSCFCPTVILFVSAAALTDGDQKCFYAHMSIHVSTFPHELVESATIGGNSTNTLEFLFFLFKHYATSQASTDTTFKTSSCNNLWFLSWCPFSAGSSFCSMCLDLDLIKRETFLIFKSFPVLNAIVLRNTIWKDFDQMNGSN